jgi:FkbM family methyltransferase
MYSQNKEEGVIGSLFGDTGRFLDVGAFDGKTFSNTLRLYERGWSGVLVEPSPLAFAGLQRQYIKDDGRAVLVQAAVSTVDGYIDLWDSGGDAISSTDTGHKEKWEKGYKCKFNKVTVPAVTFDALFNKYGTDYAFVNIDTEGTSVRLFARLMELGHRPRCICLEYDELLAQARGLAANVGYREVHYNGTNIVLVYPR